MTFDKTDQDSLWLSCTLSSEKHESSFSEEDDGIRQTRLRKLREQIRTGTYRPSIGEIAINLVKGTMHPDSFQ